MYQNYQESVASLNCSTIFSRKYPLHGSKCWIGREKKIKELQIHILGQLPKKKKKKIGVYSTVFHGNQVYTVQQISAHHAIIKGIGFCPNGFEKITSNVGPNRLICIRIRVKSKLLD